MKRSSQLKRRKRLNRVSPQKAKWRKLYAEAKKQAGPFVRSAHSGLMIGRGYASPHHPFGQVRERILAFLWVETWFHDQIHDHGQQSMAVGWLQPEFRAKPHNPDWPRPWSKSHEVDWPENLKRK